MSDDATPRLSLPYVAAGQAQKHITVNEGLSRLDGLVQLTVESRQIAAQPTTPDDGAVMSDGCHEHEDVVATGAEPKAPAQSHCKTCPICAACSLGSVVPLAASLGVPLVKLSGAVPRGLAVSFRSFIPEALQRPPSIRV